MLIAIIVIATGNSMTRHREALVPEVSEDQARFFFEYLRHKSRECFASNQVISQHYRAKAQRGSD